LVEFGSGSIERTGQILIKDNGNIRFRSLEISDASLVEKINGVVIKGWRHFFKLQFPFMGYGKIPAGSYTLSHERDIVYDPFNLLADADKPSLDTTLGLFNRTGIKEVAQGKCYKHEHQKPPSNMIDKVTWGLLVVVVLFAIAIFKMWMT